MTDDEQAAEIERLLSWAAEVRAAYSSLPAVLSDLHARGVHYATIKERTGIPISTASAMVLRHRARSD